MNDPFQLLRDQHLEIEERIEALDAEEGDLLGEKANALFSQLRLHVRLEELYLYELVQRVEGREHALEQLDDHAVVEELLAELEEWALGGREWRTRLYTLEDVLVAHFEEESRDLFPRLNSALNPSERAQLTAALQEGKDRLRRALRRTPPLGEDGPYLEPTYWDA